MINFRYFQFNLILLPNSAGYAKHKIESNIPNFYDLE